ncbi:reverse transcriptase [Ascosphaera apis ARSEF 7405]|uniref:RNA-directed DNA polymerase n=1 Tax=Ascosphaera apis ARSEF 7405 TaxID=392613 RepID=A0A168CC44_9EURO|nr:reverse transcriptase [Ascosphaera apis ARSEF 7405]
MTSNNLVAVPPPVQTMAKHIVNYYHSRSIFWSQLSPQVLAVASMVTGRHVSAPDARDTPTASPPQVRAYKTRNGYADIVGTWPPLWGTGNRGDINPDITMFYTKTASLRETQTYREIYTRLVIEGGFDRPPLGPMKLRNLPPYAEGHDPSFIARLARSSASGSEPRSSPPRSAHCRPNSSQLDRTTEDREPLQDGIPLQDLTPIDVTNPTTRGSPPMPHTPRKRAVHEHTPPEDTPYRRGERLKRRSERVDELVLYNPQYRSPPQPESSDTESRESLRFTSPSASITDGAIPSAEMNRLLDEGSIGLNETMQNTKLDETSPAIHPKPVRRSQSIPSDPEVHLPLWNQLQTFQADEYSPPCTYRNGLNDPIRSDSTSRTLPDAPAITEAEMEAVSASPIHLMPSDIEMRDFGSGGGQTYPTPRLSQVRRLHKMQLHESRRVQRQLKRLNNDNAQLRQRIMELEHTRPPSVYTLSSISSCSTAPQSTSKPVYSRSPIVHQGTQPSPKMSSNVDRTTQDQTVPQSHPEPSTPVYTESDMTRLKELLQGQMKEALEEQVKEMKQTLKPFAGRMAKRDRTRPDQATKGLDPALNDNIYPSIEVDTEDSHSQEGNNPLRVASSYPQPIDDALMKAEAKVKALQLQLDDANRRAETAAPVARSLTAAPNYGIIDREKHRKWEVKEVGIFYPDAPKAWGEGDRFYHKEMRYYRDVSSFAFEVRSYTNRNPRSPIVEYLERLLEGTAYDWYIRTPSDEKRLVYTSAPEGLEIWLQDLETKFKMGIVAARKKLSTISFGPAEIQKGLSIDRYISQITYAMMAADSMVSDSSVIATAWAQLHPDYRRQVLLPTKDTTMEAFVSELERRQVVWEEDAQSSTDQDRTRRFGNRYANRQALAASKDEIDDAEDIPSSHAYAGTSTETSADAINKALDRFSSMMDKFVTAVSQQKREEDRGPRFNYPANNRRDRRNRQRPRDSDQNQGRSQLPTDKSDFYQQRNRELDAQVERRENSKVAHLASVQDDLDDATDSEASEDDVADGLDATRPQIIECEYRSPQYQTANRSKKAVYAAFLTGFSDHQRLALVVADSGCDCTLISESFVEKFIPKAHRIPIPSTPVNGISSGVVTAEKVVFDLLVPARLNQEPVTCKIRIEAHIIPKMPAGLLIGTDNMTPERMNMDPDLQRIQFKGHKGAYTPLQPIKHDFPGPPHAIKATQPRVLLPGKDCFVPYWRKGVRPGFLRPGKDYLFEPNHPQLSFYAALLSNQTQVVIARNCSPHVYHLEKGEVLGTVVELPPMHAMVAGQGDPTIALQEGKKGVEASPLTPESDQQKHKLASGVTLAGSSDEIAYLEAVVEEFAQLWVNDGTPVDIPMRYWMTVPTKKGAEFPKRVRAYPMSPDEREITNKTLDKLHDEGKLIWSTGHTPSAFPVFVTYREVEKDGKIVRKPRVVVDIRKLNEITEPDVYPVQQQDDLLLRIAGKKHLSVFDAASFFYQWLVHPAHRHKMSVISHRGQETFNVAIMGYINSIAYVARQMANILRGCEAYCVVYVDDIIVFSDSYQDHLSHLRLIFNRLLGYNITLSPEKTFLGFNSVIILGQKVNSLGFLRKYIPRFSQIVQPLEDYKTLLLKGSPSSGGAKRKHYFIRRELTEAGTKELEAFRELQSIISKGLFLHHQDTKKPLLINVDASKEYGFGAMVYQAREDWAGYATSDFSSPPPRTKTCPIMFLSRSLQGGEARFHPTDMELACIVWVLRKIKVYVELSPRTIFYTDHASNTYIAHQSVQQASMGGYNMRLTLGAVLIRSFKNVEVKYIRGEDNTMADALSRNPGIKGYDGIPSTTDPTGCTLDPLPQHAMVTTRAKRSRQVSSLPETNEKDLMASLGNNSINPNDSADPPLPPSQDRQQLTMALPDGIRENRKQSYTEILVSEKIKTRALEGYKHDPKWTRIISQLDSKAKDAERTGRMIPDGSHTCASVYLLAWNKKSSLYVIHPCTWDIGRPYNA